VPKRSHKQSEPAGPPTDWPIRVLTNEEVERLQTRLGQPIDRDWLATWMWRAIHGVVQTCQQPSVREIRDSLLQVIKEGQQWIRHVEACPELWRCPADVDDLKCKVAYFCELANRLAHSYGRSVKSGRPTTPPALETFVLGMIMIAKKAKVYPRAEGRALRSQTAPRDPPNFFWFVVEALEIAEKVIQSSPLTTTRQEAALSILSIKSRTVLSRLIVRLRGKISDYREGPYGLTTWPIAPADPQQSS
jgi:hypothetical protein